MNVHTLLVDATATVDTTVDEDTVRADLARGHRAFSRRRARRSGAVGLVAAVAVAGALTLGGTTPADAPQGGGRQAPLDAGAIQLVDYTGDQLAGFSVDAVPSGWVLLHSDRDALTIGPSGGADPDPAVYAGKLTVLLMSQDGTLPTDGVPVEVGGAPGMVTADGGGVPGEENDLGPTDPHDLQLHFVDPASGQPVVVQVPPALGWSPEQAADFAAGVHITEAAERGVG